MSTAKRRVQTPKLNEAQRQALVRIVESGPIPAVHEVVRWRLIDLAQWVWDEFQISISKQTLSRELRAMGFRKLSARPRHHAQNEHAVEAFKKNFPPSWRTSRAAGRGCEDRDLVPRRSPRRPEEQDHCRWARRGTRPRAPHDQRTRSAYIFGAICPKEGKAAALVLPYCNSAAMTLHLKEISGFVAPDAHAVLVLDQAGWRTSGKLDVPDNISILTLPSRSPELNPVENIGQFLRDNWLSNRVFKSHDDILDHCCDAWNKLIAQPWKIMSIGHREWAHR